MATYFKKNEFIVNDEGKTEFHIGQVFDNVDHIRKAFRDYCIQVRGVHGPVRFGSVPN